MGEEDTAHNEPEGREEKAEEELLKEGEADESHPVPNRSWS